MINLVYTMEKITNDKDTIFLAGPTYRSEPGKINPKSWRHDIIDILIRLDYDGNVCLGEWRDDKEPENWTLSRQIDWEQECLSKATIILFWIPRNMQTLPALTTNIEFGEWMKSGKVVAGAPPSAYKIEYIKEKCSRLGIPWTDNLHQCTINAIDKLKKIKGNISKSWFTADTHFDHQRTLDLFRRPFANIKDMNWAIIKNWNELVSIKDKVYHLGDFGNIEYLKYLNFQEMYLIPGNYDNDEILDILRKDERISIVPSNSLTVTVGDKNFRCIHEPEKGKDPSLFYLFGHIHNLQKVKRNGLNVGVDCHNYKPISEEDLIFYRNAIENHYDNNVFMSGIGINKED